MSVLQETSHNFKTISTYQTDLNADSVEWCPHVPNQNVFVCGNYELTEQNEAKKSKRLGKILLFTFSVKHNLQLHQTIETVGILDQKWCHNKLFDMSVLGVATSTGQIVIYKLNSNELCLELICTHNVTSPDVLILSLDWSTGKFESSEPKITCSDSKGNVHLLKLCDNMLEVLGSWKGHTNLWGDLTFEGWVAGFYYWDTNLFFSGGDDGVFHMYDGRIGEKSVHHNKIHQAGVTSLHSNVSKEHILATGSYDQHVRMWDIRNIKEETSTIKMPGEVWRLKWEHYERNLLLAACMYNGVHILDFSGNNQGKLVGSYYEHKNISYGVDWSYMRNESFNEDEKKYLVGSCSFYDKLLCISQFHNKNDIS